MLHHVGDPQSQRDIQSLKSEIASLSQGPDVSALSKGGPGYVDIGIDVTNEDAGER